MSRRVVCLMVAMVFVFVAVNVASAQDAAPQPVAQTAAVASCTSCCPVTCCDPCCPPVVYRRGLFGCYRPVVAAPACYYPVYPRYVYRGWYRGGCCW